MDNCSAYGYPYDAQDRTEYQADSPTISVRDTSDEYNTDDVANPICRAEGAQKTTRWVAEVCRDTIC